MTQIKLQCPLCGGDTFRILTTESGGTALELCCATPGCRFKSEIHFTPPKEEKDPSNLLEFSKPL